MRIEKFRGNLFVTNLPPRCSDETLASHFDEYGIVLGALVARDPENGEMKNYGLVNLAPDRAVPAAVAALDGAEIGGRRIRVRPADPDMGISLPRRPNRAPPPRHGQGQGRGYGAPAPAPRTFVVERLPSRRRP